MAKAKNQTELVDRFVSGATEGTVGTLVIKGDTLYSQNTDDEEYYLPVGIRMQETDSTLFVINSYNSWTHYGMYPYHKELLEDTIRANNQADPTGSEPFRCVWADMDNITEPPNIYKFPAGEIERRITVFLKSVKAYQDDLTALKDGSYDRQDWQTSTDEELITFNEKEKEKSQQIIRLFRKNIDGAKVDTQINKIEELVRLPQIMETAIKNGGMDQYQLRRIIQSRNELRAVLADVEKYMGILLSIPGTDAEQAPAIPEI